MLQSSLNLSRQNKMSFYPKDLKEEALKQRVANDFFAKFSYEPLEIFRFAQNDKIRRFCEL